MKLWLKHVEDGSVYDWHPLLAKHPKLVEVTDEELFPEKYAPPHIVAKMEERKASKVDYLPSFDDIVIDEPPAPTNEELNAEVTVRTRKRNK
jgi:hypothetical protein